MLRMCLFKSSVVLFLCALIISPLSAKISDSEWQKLKRQAWNRKRLVIYNNDGADVIYYPRKSKVNEKNFIKQRLIHAIGSKVNTVAYAPGGSGFFTVTHRSNVGTRNYSTEYPANLPKNSPLRKTHRQIVKDLHELGTDPLKITEKFCRRNNFEFFVSLRCNDTHDTSHRPDRPHSRFSQYKRDHPEYLMGSYYKRPPYCSWSAVDFTHKEVREHFLAMIRELLTNYEVDGIELDFCRHLQYFKSVAWGGTASQQEIAMMTSCMREIRNMAEEIGRKRSRPILIAARLPDSAGYSKAVGLDIESWMREKLIDIYIGSFYLRFNYWRTSVELAHKYGVKFYASMDESRIRTSDWAFSRTTLATDRARQAAALAAGVDGIYYFNREGRRALKDMMRGTLADIILDEKRYFISYRYRSPERYLKNGDVYMNKSELLPSVPSMISKSKDAEMEIEIGDDFSLPAVKAANPKLTAVLKTASKVTESLKISLNGQELRLLKIQGKKLFYQVPTDIVKKGLNKISITSSAGEGEKREMIMRGNKLLKGRNQAPWRRVFRRHPANKEEIVDGAYRITNMGKVRYQITNLVYPLALPDDNFVKIGLQALVKKSTTPLAAAFRVANGKYVEIVTLQPDRVGLHFAKKSVKFDTSDRFHDYLATMKGDRFILEIDGKKIFDEKMSMRVSDPAGQLKHNLFNPRNLNSETFIFGSLAAKGIGIASWKNIERIHRASDVALTDLKLELKFQRKSHLSKYAEVNPVWDFELKSEKRKIKCNNELKIKYAEKNLKPGKDGLLFLDHSKGTQGFYLPLSIFGTKSPQIILAEWQIKLIEVIDKGSPFMISFKVPNTKRENVYCMLAVCEQKINTSRRKLSLPKSNKNRLLTFRLALDIEQKKAVLWLDGKELGAIPVLTREKIKPGIMFGDGSRLVQGKAALKYMKITAIKGKK